MDNFLTIEFYIVNDYGLFTRDDTAEVATTRRDGTRETLCASKNGFVGQAPAETANAVPCAQRLPWVSKIVELNF